MSNSAIARKYGVARSTIGDWVTAHPANEHSPEAIAEWGRCLDEGMAYKHIAQMFGVCAKTVQKHHPGRAWTPKQISEHASQVRRFNQTKLSLVG
jgi:transposase